MEEDCGDRAQDDRQVGDEGPVIDVVEVELTVVIAVTVAIEASADLPHAGDSRLYTEAVS